MKSFIALIISITSLGMIGCNGNSPTEREASPYPKTIQSDGLEKKEIVENQTMAVKTFDVSAEGEVSETNLLHFIAGETATYTVRARSFVSETQFALKAVNFPEGATLKASEADKSLWTITWTPSLDIIPEGQRGVDIDSSIEFKILDGTSPRAKYSHAAFEKMTDFRFTVRHSDEQPVILKSDELDEIKKVKESDKIVSFSLIVVDPKSDKENPPKLLRTYNLNRYAKSHLPAEFAIFSTDKEAEYQGNGKWKFYFQLNLGVIGYHYRSLGETGNIDVSFEMLAESRVTDNDSPAWSKTLKIALDSQEEK